MFDSHCHLDAEEYDDDRDEVLRRARVAGVIGIMVPGYTPIEWDRLAPLCARTPGLLCAVGLHPLYIHELSAREREHALASLSDRLRETGARAVGECGLDALVEKRGGSDLATQEAVLRAHVALAHTLCLPIILHCVRAHARMLALLGEYGPLPAGGVMHAYGGPAELIADYRRLRLCFSFGGIVTQPTAKRPRAALAAVPRELLLLETDGPSQVPRDAGRGRSEPADVARVAEVASALRDEPLDLVVQATTHNALALFGCDPAHFSRLS